MAEQVLRTLMRTTDIVVVGLFSPAAVAAIGLADLYARLPLRIGLGLGGGAIALSSQDTGAAKKRRTSDDETGDGVSNADGVGSDGDEDTESEADGETGSDATTNRDEVVTQAILVAALAGLPFVAFGLLFGEAAIALLGASSDVARMGGTYLAVVFLTAPARHVALVGARALQGTGDTRTPMYVNVVSNLLNIGGTLALGLGLGPFPEWRIVGVGVATAVGNAFTALALLAAIGGSWTDASFVRPRNGVVTRQLLVVSAPRIGEGLVATVAEFPFNAILLSFGTEVNAAYQIGRRVYQQVTAPLSRGYNVASSIVVGQALGEGNPEEARFRGWATAALGLLTVGAIGGVLFVGADAFVALFTDDAETAKYAVNFARTYAVAAPFLITSLVLAGSLQGGSDTKTPFYARTSGLFLFLVGFSWLVGVRWNHGVVAVYAGIALYYVWLLAVVGAGFHWGNWANRAAEMMEERGSTG